MVTFLCVDVNSWTLQKIVGKKGRKLDGISEETRAQKKKGDLPCGSQEVALLFFPMFLRLIGPTVS